MNIEHRTLNIEYCVLTILKKLAVANLSFETCLPLDDSVNCFFKKDEAKRHPNWTFDVHQFLCRSN